MDIEKIVKDCIYLNLGNLEMTNESRLVDDLGADSLDWVEIIMDIETRANVNIPDDLAAEAKTVGQLIELVESLKNQ